MAVSPRHVTPPPALRTITEEPAMAKSQDTKKSSKKAPAKTMKEKKAAKKEKRDGKKSMGTL